MNNEVLGTTSRNNGLICSRIVTVSNVFLSNVDGTLVEDTEFAEFAGNKTL